MKLLKKLTATLAAAALVALTCSALVACSGKIKTPNAYVTVDINPSIEIITDASGKISSVTALNDDAALLLVGMNFDGKTIDEVVGMILEEAKATGFIVEGEQNAIVITADAGDKTAELQKKLDARVEKFAKQSKLNIDFLAASAETDPELAARAEAAGVTFGKMKLIELAMKYDKTLTLDAAKGMAVKDLNAVVLKARSEEAELLTEEMKKEFEQFKAGLEAAEEKEEYRLLNEAIQTATAEKLSRILGAADATEFKAKFAEMFAAINAIDVDATIELSAVSDAVKLGIEQAAKALETAKQQFKDLVGKDKADASEQAVREIRKTIHRLEDELDDLIDDAEDALEGIMDGIEIDVDIAADGTVTVKVHVDIDDLIEEEIERIEDRYFGIFEDMGIDVDELEDMFEDEIEAAADAFEDRVEQQIKEYKNNLKTQIDAVRESLKAEKEALKAIVNK